MSGELLRRIGEPVGGADWDKPPRRRYRLVLDLGGDTVEDLATALWQIGRDLEACPSYISESTAGGVSYGWHYEVVCDPTQTPDEFRNQLTTWKERREAERSLASAPPAAPETEGGQPG